MDILAHTLWANAGARGANKLSEKKKGKFHLHVGWTAFWGVFPDLFAFTIPFALGIYKWIFEGVGFGRHNIPIGGVSISAYLYQFSHSIVIWALVFILVWVLSKRPRYELLGWLLHILIDIPSHAISMFPTPFLFPISDYRFPYGVQWSSMWYMIINYSLLAVVWIGITINKLRRKV